MRDPSLKWTIDGPNCPRDESIKGTLRLLPAEDRRDDSEAEGWISQPVDAAVRFVIGLLNYVGVKHRGGN